MSKLPHRIKSYSLMDTVISGMDTYVLYSLIRRIAKPFNQWKAYKLGVIDAKGNILIPKEERTNEQYKSLTYLDIFVRNIKRIIQIVPGLNSRLVTYTAALWLLREDRYQQMEVLNEDGESFSNYIPSNSSSGIALSTDKNMLLFKKDARNVKRKRISSLQE